MMRNLVSILLFGGSLAYAAVSVTVSPSSVILTAAKRQQFTATVAGTTNLAVTWAISPAVGVITAAGRYTAPASVTAPQVVTVSATSVAAPTVVGRATVTLTPTVSVTLSPPTANLGQSQTQTLTAAVSGTTSTGITWGLTPSVGSLSTSGLTAVYTAPSSITAPQTVTIKATSLADPTKIAQTVISLAGRVSVTVSPAQVSLFGGQSQGFSATVTGTTNTGVTWTLEPVAGTISLAGLYRAPAVVAAARTIKVRATSKADPSQSATGSVDLQLPLTSLSYCDFASAARLCDGQLDIHRARVDTSGRYGSGLRICKGAGCPQQTFVELRGQRLSMPRGALSFWIKQNNNNEVSGGEIFDTHPGKPLVAATYKGSIRRPITQAVAGGSTTLTVTAHGLSTGDVIRVQGAATAWSVLNGTWQVTRLDANRFTVPVNSSGRTGSAGGTILSPAQITFRHLESANIAGALAYSEAVSDGFPMASGEWHHIVWSWIGDRIQIYRNGSLVRTYVSQSPFPYNSTFPSIRVGTQAGGTQDITIDELTTYAFPFTPAEALAAWQRTTAGPLTQTVPSGMSVFGEWGPGERKVKLTLDAGTAIANSVNRYDVQILRNGTVLASNSVSAVRNGLAESLVDLPSFDTGQYLVKATAHGASGAIATAQSQVYPFVKPAWLGNNYGVDTIVPDPYWTPITVSGLKLNVVHRQYELTGGFGLLAKIKSLGVDLLARPLTLEIQQGGSTLPIQSPSVQVQQNTGNKVTWAGQATAGSQVKISVKGQMEYDGMVLLNLRLEPASGSPVSISSIRLKTSILSARSKYLYAVKDQPFWKHHWSVRPPTAPGEFNNNLTAAPKRYLTDNIFTTVFSDEERGLQVFHQNMAGWQINEAQPWQRYVREADGSVSYVKELANTVFTLSGPQEITIGYMATPVKRLPADWRLSTGGSYSGSRAPGGSLEYQWNWPDGTHWSAFRLYPDNPSAYKTNYVNFPRATGKKVLPFVSAHVLVPNPGDSWDSINLLAAETLNDGVYASPSRGLVDYWLWSMNRLLNDPAAMDVVDGYYIDESQSFRGNASLITGSGYIKPDGTHGIGLDHLGGRALFVRLAKLLISAEKPPNLWFHSTANMHPHMWSHGMMSLDAERPTSSDNTYFVESDSESTEDHFDIWNNNQSLIDPTKAGNGTWLLSVAQSQKFGLIPNMWRGIECCDSKPNFAIKQRRASCLYQMHDMLQADQERSWYLPKLSFGIDHPSTVFASYQQQTAITTSNAQVKVSYYLRPDSVLAYIANFGTATWTGTVITKPALLNSSFVTPRIKDAETGAAVNRSGNNFNITVPRHDCRVVQLDYLR